MTVTAVCGTSTTPESKPILCLDFDGVIHSYTSGWKGACEIPDPPVEGAIAFLREAVKHFRVHIFSSRSCQEGGTTAMASWLGYWVLEHRLSDDEDLAWAASIVWAKEKPPAMVSLDDRAMCFEGTWPSIEALKEFQPWYKRAAGGQVLDYMSHAAAHMDGLGRDIVSDILQNPNCLVKVDKSRAVKWSDQGDSTSWTPTPPFAEPVTPVEPSRLTQAEHIDLMAPVSADEAEQMRPADPAKTAASEQFLVADGDPRNPEDVARALNLLSIERQQAVQRAEALNGRCVALLDEVRAKGVELARAREALDDAHQMTAKAAVDLLNEKRLSSYVLNSQAHARTLGEVVAVLAAVAGVLLGGALVHFLHL